ncbi:lyase family protein [Corynebacterium riegelii]|uniref:lyase family protein n=1 Tax=Corynebacterium riegelii TaxID=156976 RepID=UPI0028890E20|nr:lyase family protein [Corynebacterium riegelii]
MQADRHSRNTYSDLASGAQGFVLADASLLNAIVEFERGLANAAFCVGRISEAQRDAAVSAIDAYELDVSEVASASIGGANPAIPIVSALRALAEDATGVHYKATSQDAIDSALMLLLRNATAELIGITAECRELLRALAEQHVATAVMARTLGQQALPTTFGAIAAGWLEQFVDAEQAVQALVFPLQYAGPVGTVSGGLDTHEALAKELGLEQQPLVWHTNRAPMVDIATAMAKLSGAVAKITGDIVLHSATEVAELRESAPGGSSSMPHKANPAASIAARGYASRVPGLTTTMLTALDCQAQRGIGSWHSEWQTIREIVAATTSAALLLRRALDGLTVDTAAMASKVPENADISDAETLARRVLDGVLEGVLERNNHVN